MSSVSSYQFSHFFPFFFYNFISSFVFVQRGILHSFSLWSVTFLKKSRLCTYYFVVYFVDWVLVFIFLRVAVIGVRLLRKRVGKKRSWIVKHFDIWLWKSLNNTTETQFSLPHFFFEALLWVLRVLWSWSLEFVSLCCWQKSQKYRFISTLNFYCHKLKFIPSIQQQQQLTTWLDVSYRRLVFFSYLKIIFVHFREKFLLFRSLVE